MTGPVPGEAVLTAIRPPSDGEQGETAPGPERAVDGGRYSLRFAVKVAFDKYVTHLPLERQVRAMSHYGLDVTSQTLWDQCSAVSELVTPTYDAIFERLRSGPVIGLDHTSSPDLEDKTLPPWQMWCFTAPDLVYHGSATTNRRRPSRRSSVTTRRRLCATRRRRTLQVRGARSA